MLLAGSVQQSLKRPDGYAQKPSNLYCGDFPPLCRGVGRIAGEVEVTKAQILAATASQTSSARPTSSGDEPSLAEPTLRIRRSGPVGILERHDPDVQKHAAVERKSRSSTGNYSSPTLPKDSDLREHRVT